MNPEIKMMGEERPVFDLDPIIHSRAVRSLPRVAHQGNSREMTVSEGGEMWFEGIGIDPSVIIGRIRDVTLVAGNTECHLMIEIFNESIGMLNSPGSDIYNKNMLRKFGGIFATISFDTYINHDDEPKNNDGGISGFIHIYSEPYIEGNFSSGTFFAKDPKRQSEYEDILRVIGLDRSVMVEEVSGSNQDGQYTTQEVERLNEFLFILSKINSDIITISKKDF